MYTVELGYNDLGLCETSATASAIPRYQLISHKARVFGLACNDILKTIYRGYNTIFSHLFQYNFPKGKPFL